MNLTFLTTRIMNMQKIVDKTKELQIELCVPNIKRNLSFYPIMGYGYDKIIDELMNTSIVGDFILVKGYVHIINGSKDKRYKHLAIKILDYQTIY